MLIIQYDLLEKYKKIFQNDKLAKFLFYNIKDNQKLFANILITLCIIINILHIGFSLSY
jgi:hypothetical protein